MLPFYASKPVGPNEREQMLGKSHLHNTNYREANNNSVNDNDCRLSLLDEHLSSNIYCSIQAWL